MSFYYPYELVMPGHNTKCTYLTGAKCDKCNNCMWLSNGTNTNDWGHWMSFSHWQDFETTQCIAFTAPKPLVCIASFAVDSKAYSTDISSVRQTRSFHWLMSFSGILLHAQPSATFFSCAASLLIDSSRYDCYHERKGAWVCMCLIMLTTALTKTIFQTVK